MPTAIEWIRLLEQKISDQERYAKAYEARYQNKFVLPFLAREYREVYGSGVDSFLLTLHPPRTGTAAIGIDALTERLTMSGFMSLVQEEQPAVALLQQAWEDNDLDVMHREAPREALIKGLSFAQADRATDGRSIVGVESPEQMAVHRTASPPYDVDAALKVFVDEWTGQRQGTLRLPGRDLSLVESAIAEPDPEGSGKSSRWRVTGERATGLPWVPVVEFQPRPRLLSKPVSEIEPIESLVDIVDLIEGLMVFAGHFGAVPIRFATGLEIPRDPKDPTKPLMGPDGKPVMGFKPRADHFWANTSKDAKFGQLTPAAVDGLVTWAEHATGRVRAKTTVPASYYGVSAQTHMSAELLKTDEAPMVRRVLSMGRDGSMNQSWRRLGRMMLAIEDPRLARARVVPRWNDPETRVEAQAMDAFQKAVASGLGVRTAAEKILGWAPELVERAVAEAEAAKAAEVDPIELATRALSNLNPPVADPEGTGAAA